MRVPYMYTNSTYHRISTTTCLKFTLFTYIFSKNKGIILKLINRYSNYIKFKVNRYYVQL